MIRFRTQDTRASTRRKLNELFELTGENRFFAPSPTLIEWAVKLNGLSETLISLNFPLDSPVVFRVDDTRQMWTRKLNILAAAVEAGPANPEPPVTPGG